MINRYSFDDVYYEDECIKKDDGDFVKYEDYEALKAVRDAQQKRADALAVENDRARKAVQIFSDATQELTEIIGDEIGMDGVAMLLAGFDAVGNMPATDAALSAIQLSIEESRFLTDVITAAGFCHAGNKTKDWPEELPISVLQR